MGKNQAANFQGNWIIVYSMPHYQIAGLWVFQFIGHLNGVAAVGAGHHCIAQRQQQAVQDDE